MKVGLVSFREIGTGLFEPIETQWEGWSLMIFCARATRSLRRPSPGLMTRFGVPVGGRVRKLRAVEDQSGLIPGRERASLEGWDRSSQVSFLLAERAR